METADPHTLASPTRMTIILAASVFGIELMIMVVFSLLPPLPGWLENILDALILVVLLSPLLYFSLFLPLVRSAEQSMKMRQELLAQRECLQDLLENYSNEIARRDQEDELASYVMERCYNLSHHDPRVEYSISFASQHFGGDAVFASATPGGGLNVVMLDAMGHGLSAAISALPVIQSFHIKSRRGVPLEDIVYELNNRIHDFSPSGHFLAATFIHLNANSSRLKAWIGGAPKMYVMNGNEIMALNSSNLALGVLKSKKADFEFHDIPWGDHSLLVTCTDGVYESLAEGGKELGEAWILDLIKEHGAQVNKSLFESTWKAKLGNNSPHDDATILIINQALAQVKQLPDEVELKPR